MTRVITALIGIPLLIFIVQFAPDSVAVSLIFLCMLVALYECLALTMRQRSLPILITGYVIAAGLMACFYFPAFFSVFWLPSAALLILLAALFSPGELRVRFESAAAALFGAWYVGGLMGYLVGVRRIGYGGEMGADLLMLLLVIIWSNDTFAYFVGRAFGKHKLATTISPNKTIEGAIAGLLFGTIASVVSHFIFIPQLSFFHLAMIGFVVGVMGQLGDLCESMLKRSANVKDSGGIIPGHGGMLDRIDSLLFGAPAMYYYFYLVLTR